MSFTREIIQPRDIAHWLQCRSLDITSTEISALFNLSPYDTYFSLWHRKKDQVVVTLEENERMKWGTRLQDSIAAGIAVDKGWQIRRMDEYIRIPELRLGASYDFGIIDENIIDARYTDQLDPRITALLEIKNVDSLIFKENWDEDDDGNIEAPPHIELQVQQQMLVSGVPRDNIGALIGGNKVQLIEREADEKIQQAIIKKSKAFWESIDKGIAPRPDFERDAEAVAKIYSHAEPGKVLDRGSDEQLRALADEHRLATQTRDAAEAKRSAIKAQILTLIGDAESVTGAPGTFSSISAGVVGPAEYTVNKAGYRMFKINWPRKKKGSA